MALEQEYKYKVCDGVKYTQNEEEKIINLLKDVRASVALLKPALAKQRLDAILEVVEKGEWHIQKIFDSKDPWVEINYNIDLYQAKQIIDSYRHNSEGGCKSCKKIASYMPLQDEHVTYCSLYEEATVVSCGDSPRIAKFYEKGCGIDRRPKIKRKLEEVLKDYKSE